MKQMKRLMVILGVGIMLLCSSQAFAYLFSDNFESGSLSAWTGNSSGANGSPSGQILTDPLGSSNKVLNFTSLGSGGDIYTIESFTAGDYILSFDYLGLYLGEDSQYASNQTVGDLGGFIGYSTGIYSTTINTLGAIGTNHWLAGTKGYSDSTSPFYTDSLTDGNGWNSYFVTFTANDPFHIMVEDFVGSGGVAGDAYFDNIELNTAPVPEPATMLLLGFGLLGLAGFRKKLIKS